MTKADLALCFIVESGTDARLVEGLAARAKLQVLARSIPGGRAISQPTGADVVTLPPGRASFAARIFKSIVSGGCDVVLVQGYGPAALAANLAARVTGRRCWMLVCSPVAEYYATRRQTNDGYSAVTHFAIQLLGHLNGIVGQGYVVLSRHLGEVVRQYGRSKPVHVVPVYGVDVARFTGRRERANVRTQRGLPETGAIIFSSSRVAPEKDTTTLLDAFAELVREGRDVHLLNRSGGHREFLEEARRRGVAGRVIATDAVDPRGDLPLDYLASDVVVQASRAEGLGFSVLEALATGTPVVVSAVGGLTETVRDGVTGWTVPPGSAPALAAALRDALDHPEEARRRAAAGAAVVRERFESGRVFDDLVAVLRGAVRR